MNKKVTETSKHQQQKETGMAPGKLAARHWLMSLQQLARLDICFSLHILNSQDIIRLGSLYSQLQHFN